MNKNAERKEFEKWLVAYMGESEEDLFERAENDLDYDDDYVELAWNAWMARAERIG